MPEDEKSQSGMAMEAQVRVRSVAVAALLVAACCLVGISLLVGRHSGPIERLESIRAARRQYSRVAAKNKVLEREDRELKLQVRPCRG